MVYNSQNHCRDSFYLGEKLYYDVQKVRKEMEQALSTVIKQDVLNALGDLFSRDSVVLIDLSGAVKLEEKIDTMRKDNLQQAPWGWDQRLCKNDRSGSLRGASLPDTRSRAYSSATTLPFAPM